MADLVSGYNIIEKLGDGARSQVFQVVHPPTGKVFALKRVTREKHEDNRFLNQAITEYEISSRLDHPCLRKAFELKRIRSWFRLSEVQVVLEYVEGISLDKRRPERIDEAVDLFLNLAEGLDAMHEGGFLHTDIKPNNILITSNGKVKIIDFGQSCVIGFRKPRIQGTPDYIAPEQVERHRLTLQTDVFNLGATLYWALTGKTWPTVITKKGRNRGYDPRKPVPVPSPQELNPEIPSVLSRLVMQSCSHARPKRPRDMKEVIDQLETAHHVLAKRRRSGHDMTAKTRPAEKPDRRAKASAVPPTQTAAAAQADDSYDYSAFTEIAKEAGQEPDQDKGSQP